MVAELSALQQIVTALTGLDGLPAVIVECAVTTIYTCELAASSLPFLLWPNPLTAHPQPLAGSASPS